MKKIMVIGYGAMAKHVIANLPSDVSLGYLLVKPEKVTAVQEQIGADVKVIGHVDDLDAKPDAVIEMAGQLGLKQHALGILSKGLDLGVISIGAFSDAEFEANVKKTSKENGSKVYILSGAIAGIDGLSAAKEAGLAKVVYQGIKSSKSWKGTPAENLVNLDNLTEATAFFTGTAREAASMFPANANVAATIALAGVGMDETQVELIADPNTTKNQHLLKAYGTFGEMEVTMSGKTLGENSKTSMLAALSVLKFCKNLTTNIIV